MGAMSNAAIKVRPFVPDDAPAVIDIYNQARPIEVAQLTEDRFWAWFGDPALDPARDVLVAADDQGPVGIIASFPWPNHVAEGYVFFVGPSVLPEFQAHGVGRQLLEALAQAVAQRHPDARLQTRLNVSNTHAHQFLLDRMGFQVEKQFWQMRHGAPGKHPAGPAPAGYEFAYLAPGTDASEEIEVYGRILNDPAVGRHLLKLDELANWASLGNYAAHSFQVARRDGRVVGLCFESFPAGADYAQVEFLGVLPSERGKGVARHLLERALVNARESGRGAVRLEVTDDGNLAMDLYRKAGFEVTGGEVFYTRRAVVPVA